MMAHLYITEKLKINASDVLQGIVTFRDQGHLTKFLPRKRYDTLRDAVLEVTRAMKLQEAEDAELACVVRWALGICEISSQGHDHDVIMRALEARTELPAAMIARALKVIGYSVVVIENVEYFSGSVDGHAGYLRLRT